MEQSKEFKSMQFAMQIWTQRYANLSLEVVSVLADLNLMQVENNQLKARIVELEKQVKELTPAPEAPPQ